MKQIDLLIYELHKLNCDIKFLETNQAVTGLSVDSNRLVKAAGINILYSRKVGLLDRLRNEINFHVEV